MKKNLSNQQEKLVKAFGGKAKGINVRGPKYHPPYLRMPEEYIRDTIEYEIPEFAKMCSQLKSKQTEDKEDIALVHQDAFAAGYTLAEIVLLGLAVKYAGLLGISFMFHGTNGETFSKESTDE